MSSRRDLEIRLGSLNEIKEIMSAMKNLSLMEVHKLSRFLENQRRVIDSIETAAADLLQFHRTLFPESVTCRDFYLLVGSERGFCGDFNEALIELSRVMAQQLRRTPWWWSAPNWPPSWPATRAFAPRSAARAWWKR
jgi:F-type H+-transporting ATPase subunit gamma